MMSMPNLHVGRGTHLGALSVFPIWAEGPAANGLTGRTTGVLVAEREGSPVVGELVLTNTGAQAALLVAGEIFEGGWQHRVLNHDLLLMPGQSLVASVCCVEHGRWNGQGTHRRQARRASMMVRAAQTTTSGAGRQQQVWDRVSRYDRAFGASATASYVDHLDHHTTRAPNLDPNPDGAICDGIETIRAIAGQRGVLIGLGGQPAFLELFATPTHLRRALAPLLDAAALDAALLPAEPTPNRRARRFVGALTAALLSDHTGTDAGAGRALAARSHHHDIRALAWNDQLVHATVFNRRHTLMALA
jgi:hypothetical protein